MAIDPSTDVEQDSLTGEHFISIEHYRKEVVAVFPGGLLGLNGPALRRVLTAGRKALKRIEKLNRLKKASLKDPKSREKFQKITKKIREEGERIVI